MEQTEENSERNSEVPERQLLVRRSARVCPGRRRGVAAFEKMLTYANHLGFYSEEIGPRGELLGSFLASADAPRAITAATTLNEALG